MKTLHTILLIVFFILCTNLISCKTKRKIYSATTQETQSDSTAQTSDKLSRSQVVRDSTTSTTAQDVQTTTNEDELTEWERYDAEGKLIARLRRIRLAKRQEQSTTTSQRQTIHEDSTQVKQERQTQVTSKSQSTTHSQTKEIQETPSLNVLRYMNIFLIVLIIIAGGVLLYDTLRTLKLL